MKYIITMICFVTCTLLVSSSYAEFKCYQNGRIQYFSGTERIIKNSSYCIDHYRYDFVSFNCIQDNNCKAVIKYQDSKGVSYSSLPDRSPYSEKCRIIGGTSRLVSYLDEGWKNIEICEFGDNSFISVHNRIDL